MIPLYGGFPGMVLKPEPIVAAYEHVLSITSQKPFVIKTRAMGQNNKPAHIKQFKK